METTKINIRVEENNAIMAGSKLYGWVTIEYDPSTLTEKQREFIANLSVGKQIFTSFGIASTENLGTIIDEYIATKEREKIVREEREEQAKQEELKEIEKHVQNILSMSNDNLANKINTYNHRSDIDYKGYNFGDLMTVAYHDPRTYDKFDKAIKIYEAQKIEQAEKEKIAWESKKEKEKRIKNQFTAWVDSNMTDTQKKRFAAGLLPDKEIIDSIRDFTFAPLNDEPIYTKITEREVRNNMSNDQYYEEAEVHFNIDPAKSVTDEQFEKMESMTAKIPGAKVKAKKHYGYINEDDDKDIEEEKSYTEKYSTLVTVTVGELTLSREYALQI